MLFSIITVCYNAAGTIVPTLRSVAEQSFHDFEHIIEDGASKDSTVELCGEHTIAQTRLFSEPDRGIYDAMNKAMARARGEYLIFLNAGDAFPSADTLAEYARAIAENDFPGIVYGQTTLVDAERRPVGPRHLTAPRNLTWRSFADGMLVCHQAMAVKRSITEPYDLQYRFSADFDWVIKCLRRSDHNHYMDQVTALYLNEGATTANHRKSLMERFRIMCGYYGTVPTLLRHIKFALR